MLNLVQPSADYQDIDPRYGTLEDWDRLKDAMHAREMKIMLAISMSALKQLLTSYPQNGPRG